MNSRERVLAALNHQMPDRVPLDLGGQQASTISVEAYVKVKNLLGLRTDNVQVMDIWGMMPRVELDLIERLSLDAMEIPSLYCYRYGIPIDKWKPWRMPDGTPVYMPVGFNPVEDSDGSLVIVKDGKAVGRMPKGGYYFQEFSTAVGGGFEALAEPPDPDSVEFPLFTDEDLRFRQGIARNLYEDTDKFLLTDLGTNLRWDTSFTNWLYAVGLDPQRTFELHQKKSENLLVKIKQLVEALGPYVGGLTIGQDMGTQNREFISPETYDWLIASNYRPVFDWMHQNSDWKVVMHSCGSIYRLIPHMISMGVDVLNPVQCAAANMDPRRLKAEFGDRLVFWGGGVDTQTVLPFGTEEDVRQQVRERIAILGAGGGYVFAPTQDIQATDPPENIVAMYEEALAVGRYPVGAA